MSTSGPSLKTECKCFSACVIQTTYIVCPQLRLFSTSEASLFNPISFRVSMRERHSKGFAFSRPLLHSLKILQLMAVESRCRSFATDSTKLPSSSFSSSTPKSEYLQPISSMMLIVLFFPLKNLKFFNEGLYSPLVVVCGVACLLHVSISRFTNTDLSPIISPSIVTWWSRVSWRLSPLTEP